MNMPLTAAVMCQVEGMQLVVDDLVGSTGLELKVDPGVPYVYAGFAGKPLVSPVAAELTYIGCFWWTPGVLPCYCVIA